MLWKKSVLFLIGTLTTTLLSVQAHALVDARLTYGLLGSKPALGELFSGSPTSLPEVTPTYGIGADLIVSPPFIPVGVGLRYENMGVSAASGGYEFKANYTRTSILLNYRLIDTLLFLGPIASYGLSHSGEIKAIQNGQETSNWTSNKISSYSIGLEGGVKLIGFRLGGELGYQDFHWDDATDKYGAVAASRNINMSGSYVKVHVGFGI